MASALPNNFIRGSALLHYWPTDDHTLSVEIFTKWVRIRQNMSFLDRQNLKNGGEGSAPFVDLTPGQILHLKSQTPHGDTPVLRGGPAGIDILSHSPDPVSAPVLSPSLYA